MGKGQDVTLRVERQPASKRRLLRLLDELESSELYDSTLYVGPGESGRVRLPQVASEALAALAADETGAAVFAGAGRAVAVAPPFPLGGSSPHGDVETTPLRELLNRDLVVGVALLRLGRYAVGVLRGETLLATKTDTRYVKNRHRKGGSSQRRFARSRDRLVREFFDKTCEVTQRVFSPHEKEMDYVLLGGERHTLRAFVERCGYMDRNRDKTLSRVLSVRTPNNVALGEITREVWRSRVVFAEEERSALVCPAQ